MKGVTLSWLAFLAIQTYQFEKAAPVPALPPPSLYVGSALTFSLLGAVAQVAPKPATYMSVALLVAVGVRNQFKTAGKPADLTRTPGTKPAAKKGGK